MKEAAVQHWLNGPRGVLFFSARGIPAKQAAAQDWGKSLDAPWGERGCVRECVVCVRERVCVLCE